MNSKKDKYRLDVQSTMVVSTSLILDNFAEKGIKCPRKVRKAMVEGNLLLESITFDNPVKSLRESGLIVSREEGRSKGTILVMHPTISLNDRAPSVAMFSTEILLACAGYTLLIPDYLGFGSTSEMVHPYIHAESAALSGIGICLSSKEYLASCRKWDGEALFLVGYSEGGHAAMAFQKYAESGEYGEFNISKSYFGAGPYDLILTLKRVVEIGETGYPYGIAMVPIGIDAGEGMGLDMSHIFKGELAQNYQLWLKDKKFRASEVNEMIGSNKVDDFMNYYILNKQSDDQAGGLLRALEKNSLLEGWIPKAPISLIHGTQDDYVPVENSREAFATFKKAGCDVRYEEVKRGGHKEIMIYFLFNIISDLNTHF